VFLAVLHPRRLVVYHATSTTVHSETGEDTFMSLHLLYKHGLARSACNMCKGPFGIAKGKDYICVQSLDGELLFLEQERVSFSKFLPNFLVPGPICYVPQVLFLKSTIVPLCRKCRPLTFQNVCHSRSTPL
jgi:Bardet-Biedl syndrome 9 protein